MVLFLLRREDSLKLAGIGALFAPMVLLPEFGQAVMVWGFLGWLSFVLLVSAARFRLDQRVNRFEVTLPIATRPLLVARMIGSVLTVWAPVSTACLALLLFRQRTASSSVTILAQGAAVLTLVAVLPLTVRLGEATISGWTMVNLWLATLAIGVATWFVLPPLVHVLLFVFVSGAFLAWACVWVPPSFQTSPFDVTVDRTGTPGRGITMPAWWPIVRSTLPRGLGVGAFAMGLLGGGSIQLGLQLFFLILQGGLFTRNRTRWLLSFPLSYRTLLALTLASNSAPFLIGFAIGTWVYQPAIVPRLKQPVIGIGPGLDLKHSFYRTNVPLEFWRYARAGNVPLIRAPWGETVRPEPISILGFSFYNPYASSEANSKPYIEWQFENATQAVHGRRIASDDYYEVRAGLPKDAITTRVEILLLSTLAFLLLVGTWCREWGLSHSWKRNMVLARGMLPMLISMFLFFGLDLFYQVRHNTNVVAPFLHVVLLRVASVLPANLAVLSLIAALPSVGMYWLAERQFAKSELAGPFIPLLESMGRGMERQ